MYIYIYVYVCLFNGTTDEYNGSLYKGEPLTGVNKYFKRNLKLKIKLTNLNP